tara:strand:+ start:599 stop:799 length:201 start_codon:yes stop_codon:yes gene_type:complete
MEMTDIKLEVGRLYSSGLEYNEAQKQFLVAAAESSAYQNDLVAEFDATWETYEHMRFSALSFMKNN